METIRTSLPLRAPFPRTGKDRSLPSGSPHQLRRSFGAVSSITTLEGVTEAMLKLELPDLHECGVENLRPPGPVIAANIAEFTASVCSSPMYATQPTSGTDGEEIFDAIYDPPLDVGVYGSGERLDLLIEASMTPAYDPDDFCEQWPLSPLTGDDGMDLGLDLIQLEDVVELRVFSPMMPSTPFMASVPLPPLSGGDPFIGPLPAVDEGQNMPHNSTGISPFMSPLILIPLSFRIPSIPLPGTEETCPFAGCQCFPSYQDIANANFIDMDF